MEAAIFSAPRLWTLRQCMFTSTERLIIHATRCDAAIGMGRIVKESLSEIRDGRPFLDTEHGPIHTYKE